MPFCSVLTNAIFLSPAVNLNQHHFVTYFCNLSTEIGQDNEIEASKAQKTEPILRWGVHGLIILYDYCIIVRVIISLMYCNETAKRKRLCHSGTFMAQWFRRWNLASANRDRSPHGLLQYNMPLILIPLHNDCNLLHCYIYFINVFCTFNKTKLFVWIYGIDDILSLYWLSGWASYRTISWSLTARLDVIIIISLWK